MIDAQHATRERVSKGKCASSLATAADRIGPTSFSFTLRETGLRSFTLLVPIFVVKNFRRIRAYLKSIIEHIDPPHFPGSCCG
jgi:hypothetical protein